MHRLAEAGADRLVRPSAALAGVVRRFGERLGRGLAPHLDRVTDLPCQPVILLHHGVPRVAVSIRWRVSDVPPM